MRVIRFVVAQPHPESGIEDGVFRSAYRLRDAPDVEPADRAALAEILKWFGENLDTPARFNRTTSKGFYRRNTRGIAWFKDTATEHLTRMHQMKEVLQRYGVSVTMISQARVGYVVFDDEFQVVAEPFKATQTG